MASPLDLGLLHSFSSIFPWLLVFAFVYGGLSATSVFGGNKGIQAIVAFTLATMTVMFPIIRETLRLMAPWFVFFFFFIIFILIIVQLFGASSGDIAGVLKGPNGPKIINWVIMLTVLLTLAPLFSTLANRGGIGKTANTGEGIDVINATTGQPETQESDFWRTIVHPKVLALALLFLIATFAIIQLTYV